MQLSCQHWPGQVPRDRDLADPGLEPLLKRFKPPPPKKSDVADLDSNDDLFTPQEQWAARVANAARNSAWLLMYV